MVLKMKEGEIMQKNETIRPYALASKLDRMFEDMDNWFWGPSFALTSMMTKEEKSKLQRNRMERTIQSRELMPLISNPKTAVCSNSSLCILTNMLETALYEIASNVPLNRDGFGNNPIYPPLVLSSKYGGNEIPCQGDILPGI